MLTSEQQQQVQDYLKNKQTTTETQPTDLRTKLEQAYIKKEAESRLAQQSQLQNKPKGLLEKVSNLTEKTFGKASDLFFGSTGKTVGGLITGGIGSASALAGKKTFGQSLEKQAEEAITPTNIAFTTLELYPGGGELGKLLSKIPGSSKLVSKIDDAVKILPKSLREKAIKLYTEALAPTTKKTKLQAKKIVPELLERKEKAGIFTGLKKIEEKAVEGLRGAGELIDAEIEMMDKVKKLEVKPIINSLRKFAKEAIIEGTDVVAEPTKVAATENIAKVITDLGKEASVKSLRSLRQIWDDTIKKAGKGFGRSDADNFLLGAKKEATNSIREVLALENPTLDLLNKEYSFWSNVSEVISETLLRKSSQIGKKGRIAQVLGGVLGSTLGPKEAAIGALVGRKLEQAFGSAAWKTRSAIWKNELAKHLVDGSVDKVFLMLKELGVVTQNEIDKLTTD